MPAVPLPPMSNTWSTRANIPFPANATAEDVADSAWFLLKACLMDQVVTGTLTGVRHANSVWTCVRSCDGTTAGTGTDGIDRWGGAVFDASKIVHATGNHSWFLMENSTIARQLLLDTYGVTTTSGRIAATKTSVPYTGGTAGAGPAATTESWMAANSSADTNTSTASFFGDTTIGASHYAHFSCDSTGQFIFIVNRSGAGLFNGGVGLLKTAGAVLNDTRNVLFFGGASSVAARGWPNSTSLDSISGCTSRDPVGTDTSNNSGVIMPRVAGTSLLAQNSITDALESLTRFIEFPYYCANTTYPVSRGVLVDVYGVIGGGVGTSYPTVAAQTWIQAGNVLIPFITTIPLL